MMLHSDSDLFMVPSMTVSLLCHEANEGSCETSVHMYADMYACIH